MPYTITSSGTLSRHAAHLLYANCCEHPPTGPLQVLEIGAGTGLFARLFISEFAALCRAGGQKHDGQMIYYVTDRSRQSLEQWQRLGLFADCPVVMGLADGRSPTDISVGEETRKLSGLRAVFCNYALDSMPATVVRKGQNGPEELVMATHLTADEARIRRTTRLSLAEIREQAARLDPGLLPLIPLFEFEAGFQTCSRQYPYMHEALALGHDWPRVILNYGAVECLERTLAALDAHGLALINDYGILGPADAATMGGAQRFGSSTALGLNFPFLEQHFSQAGAHISVPEGDEQLPLHPRLFSKARLPQTEMAFHRAFDLASLRSEVEPLEDARRHVEAGRFEAAKAAYERALAVRPQDWVIMGEIAEFLIRSVADFESGLSIAQAALATNPWYSVWLWNVLGDAQYALGRFVEAHEVYLRAAEMDPDDVRTNLNLAYSHAQLGALQLALKAVARGLANDREGIFRSRLLEKQQHIIAGLDGHRQESQEWATRRALRINNA